MTKKAAQIDSRIDALQADVALAGQDSAALDSAGKVGWIQGKSKIGSGMTARGSIYIFSGMESADDVTQGLPPAASALCHRLNRSALQPASIRAQATGCRSCSRADRTVGFFQEGVAHGPHRLRRRWDSVKGDNVEPILALDRTKQFSYVRSGGAPESPKSSPQGRQRRK